MNRKTVVLVCARERRKIVNPSRLSVDRSPAVPDDNQVISDYVSDLA
jgi:hypothetical protein